MELLGVPVPFPPELVEAAMLLVPFPPAATVLPFPPAATDEVMFPPAAALLLILPPAEAVVFDTLLPCNCREVAKSTDKPRILDSCMAGNVQVESCCWW